jgi:probable biosynthetic protein (TIGR04098 family)
MTAVTAVRGQATEDAPTLRRVEIVRPALSGHGWALPARIGDWTWDATSAVCGVDVLGARTDDDQPTYLSFFYYRICGSRSFHLRSPQFGDQLHVGSRVLGMGAQSVLTLHRLHLRAGDSTAPPDSVVPQLPPDAPAEQPPGQLLVVNVNRWVARSRAGDNGSLVSAAPAGFQTHLLEQVPRQSSPKALTHRAQTQGTFRSTPADEVGSVLLDYEVDPSRDLNAAGLLYFAAYFGIVDGALYRAWRRWGRGTAQFLDRVVVDQQIGYFGNADAETRLAVTVRHLVDPARPHLESFDVVLREQETQRLLAVCTLWALRAATADR